MTVVHLVLRVTEAVMHPRGFKWIYSPKLPKLDLTTEAEYVANVVNVNMWLYDIPAYRHFSY